MSLIHKLRSDKKVNDILKRSTLVFLSVFLSINTIYFYIPGASNLKLMVTTTIILFLLYYFIISRLIITYNKLLNWINLKLNKDNLRFLDMTTHIVWLPSAFISAIFSFILFWASNRYMILEEETLGDKIDYAAIVMNLNSTYFPIILTGFILIGLILQILVLERSEKIKLFPAFLSSFLTIIIFTFIFFIIKNIISNTLTWL